MNAEAMPAMKNAKMPVITTASVNVEASCRTAGGSRWISRRWERFDMTPSLVACASPSGKRAEAEPVPANLFQEYSPSPHPRLGPKRLRATGRFLPKKASTEEGRHHEHDHEQRQRHVDFAGARPPRPDRQ